MNAATNPTLGNGSVFSQPTMTVQGLNPATNMGYSYPPTAAEKALTFNLTYFNNGVSGATTTYTFTLTYGKSRNEYDALT